MKGKVPCGQLSICQSVRYELRSKSDQTFFLIQCGLKLVLARYGHIYSRTALISVALCSDDIGHNDVSK